MLLAALVCGCSKSDTGTSSENGAAPETEVSETTPDTGESFQAQSIDGEAISSDIFSRSRLTMVNVWATYCNPCLREMPALGELAGAYDSADFQLIGIISDVMEGSDEDTLANASDLILQTGADYPHLLLNESLYYALLTDVTAVPTTFFVDQEGNVLDTVIGAMDKSSWEEKINAFLEE